MTKSLAALVLSLGLFTAGSAYAHWETNCPVPHDLPTLWLVYQSPVIGWRYPCHKIMRNFAPPTCWRTYKITTALGIETRHDFFCR